MHSTSFANTNQEIHSTSFANTNQIVTEHDFSMKKKFELCLKDYISRGY